MRTGRTAPLRVRLAPEWPNQHPVWIARPGGVDPEDVPAAGLGERYGVSAALCADIDAWDRAFQAIYRPDDPRESAFPDEEAMHHWYARGRELAEQLAVELGPTVRVEVVRMGGGFEQVGRDDG